MKFFSNGFYEWMKIITPIFATLLGYVLICDSNNKPLLAMILVEAFIICILILIIFQFIDRENETKNHTSILQNKISDLSAQLTMANKIIEISKNSQTLYSSLSNIYNTRCIDGQKGFQHNEKDVDKAS